MFTRLKRLFSRNRRNNPRVTMQPLPVQAQLRRIDENVLTPDISLKHEELLKSHRRAFEESSTPLILPSPQPVTIVQEFGDYSVPELARFVLKQREDLKTKSEELMLLEQQERERIEQLRKRKTEQNIENQKRIDERLNEVIIRRQQEEEAEEEQRAQTQVRPSAPIAGSRRLASPRDNEDLMKAPRMPVRRLSERAEAIPGDSCAVQVFGEVPGQVSTDHPINQNTPLLQPATQTSPKIRREHSASDLQRKTDKPKQFLPRTTSFRIAIDSSSTQRVQEQQQVKPVLTFPPSESLRIAREKALLEKETPLAEPPAKAAVRKSRAVSNTLPCGPRTQTPINCISEDGSPQTIEPGTPLPLCSFKLPAPASDDNTALHWLIEDRKKSESRSVSQRKLKRTPDSAPEHLNAGRDMSPCSISPKSMS